MKKKTKKRSAPRASAAKKKPARARTRAAAKARPKRAAAKSRAAAGSAEKHGKKLLVSLFAKESPVTLRLMKAYSGEDHYTPHERSTPAARLAYTFSMNHGIAVKAITGELHMPPEFPPAPATYAEAVSSYERGARELIAALEKMPESRLSDTVEFFIAPGQTGQIPVGDLLWLMLMDSIHHRGQLSVYVRMAGGRVPSIYGPSADEPWI